MNRHVTKRFGFLKTTAVGGVLFLLPLAVIGGLLGYVYGVVIVIYEPLHAWLPLETATGIALLFGIAVATLLLLCFIAGLMATRAIGRRFSQVVEKQLITIFPKYAIYKDLLAGNLGEPGYLPSLTPIIVEQRGERRPAFEADRLADGTVVAYLPGAPDPWIGHVSLVDPAHVRRVDISFPEYIGILERLGRDSGRILDAATTTLSEGPHT